MLNESCNLQFKEWNKNLNIKTAQNPFNIMDPLFNIRNMIKEMILLEDHLNIPAQYCPDCIVKHLLKCEALAEEAISLDGGENKFLYNLPTIVKEWHTAWLKEIEPTIVASYIRKTRKSLMPIITQFSKNIVASGGSIKEVSSLIREISEHSQKTL
jgi:hypothetical protein